MEIKWTKQALNSFNSIQNQHFTSVETREYKLRLIKKIQEKVSILGTSMPVNHIDWESTYKIIVDSYIVYYSFSVDRKICYIALNTLDRINS